MYHSTGKGNISILLKQTASLLIIEYDALQFITIGSTRFLIDTQNVWVVGRVY